MRFRRAYIAAMCRGDKDRAAGMSSLANEEPSMVVKACVDVVRKIVREDCGDSRDSVIREGEAALCGGGRGSIRQWTSGTKDGYIGCGWGVCGHRGSEVFAPRRSDKDVVGVNGDVLVERGEKESVEYFLGYAGRSGRHGEW